MSRYTKLSAFALLWLVFAGMAFAAPIQVNFTKVGHDYSIDGGGRFQGQVNSGPVFDLFCIDYQNSINQTSYNAYLSDSTDLSKTRYGTTSSFAYNPGSGTLTASDRYVLAAWLITQYTFPFSGGSPAPTTDDFAIQNAIWTLLAQTGAPAVPEPGLSGIATWINNAINFKNTNSAGFNTIKSNLRVLTSTDVAGSDTRYKSGQQEFLWVTNPVPEPSTYLMFGAGLMALGLIRKRRA